MSDDGDGSDCFDKIFVNKSSISDVRDGGVTGIGVEVELDVVGVGDID